MTRLLAIGPALGLLLLSCDRQASVSEVSGPCVDYHRAQVCTWAMMQGENLLEVGATVPLASIENAPMDHEMGWPPVATVVNVPASAVAKSGINHLSLYWEPTGHPPGPYLTPHFDFHFNLISNAEREAIDCADTTRPSALPAAYSLIDLDLPPEMAEMVGTNTLVGLCVPAMGMHALPASDLQSSEIFRGTMVIGFYKGSTTFVEPMITKAMLMERQSFTLPIPTIPGLVGAHPTQFRADYDAESNRYRFVFSDFRGG